MNWSRCWWTVKLAITISIFLKKNKIFNNQCKFNNSWGKVTKKNNKTAQLINKKI